MKRSALLEEQISKIKVRQEKIRRIVQKIRKSDKLFDEDGYPSYRALLAVRLWNYDDPEGWFEFINSLWHHRSYGWHEEVRPLEYRSYRKQECRHYDISTLGWSGNESIIHEMQNNEMLWHFTWFSSRRGGHYVFVLEKD